MQVGLSFGYASQKEKRIIITKCYLGGGGGKRDSDTFFFFGLNSPDIWLRYFCCLAKLIIVMYSGRNLKNALDCLHIDKMEIQLLKNKKKKT